MIAHFSLNFFVFLSIFFLCLYFFHFRSSTLNSTPQAKEKITEIIIKWFLHESSAASQASEHEIGFDVFDDFFTFYDCEMYKKYLRAFSVEWRKKSEQNYSTQQQWIELSPPASNWQMKGLLRENLMMLSISSAQMENCVTSDVIVLRGKKREFQRVVPESFIFSNILKDLLNFD